MRTLDSLTPGEWEEIRERFGVSKILVWRASTLEEARRHQGKPVGMRLLGDSTYEVQINADAIRCRPRCVPKEQFHLYCLYCALAHVDLGHFDDRIQQQWLKSRIRTGRSMGLKTLRAELDKEASRWAIARLEGQPLPAVDEAPQSADRRLELKAS